jgi:hypothetical protein
MLSANHVRKLVSDFLSGAIDLEKFSTKFAVLFDDIEDSGDADTIRVSYHIESNLADLSAGLISELELRAALTQCLQSVVVDIKPEFRGPEENVQKRPSETAPYEPAELEFA